MGPPRIPRPGRGPRPRRLVLLRGARTVSLPPCGRRVCRGPVLRPLPSPLQRLRHPRLLRCRSLLRCCRRRRRRPGALLPPPPPPPRRAPPPPPPPPPPHRPGAPLLPRGGHLGHL